MAPSLGLSGLWRMRKPATPSSRRFSERVRGASGVSKYAYRSHAGFSSAFSIFGWRRNSVMATPDPREGRGWSPAGSWHEQARRLLFLVNARRAYRGLPPLRERQGLVDMAANHSRDMAHSQIFSHEGSVGVDLMARFRAGGMSYKHGGQCIAFGQRMPDETIFAWMERPHHRATILDTRYKYLGVGVERDRDGRMFWTLILAG